MFSSFMDKCGWLRQVSYKPGWQFELYRCRPFPDSRHGELTLAITVKVPDSEAPHRVFEGTHILALDSSRTQTREQFLWAIVDCIEMIERHETMEYLKFNGAHMKDPHPTEDDVLYDF